MAAVSAEGSTVWVLIRRLNSSGSPSIALVVRTLFHWLPGNRVKVKSRSPASSRLSATALHLSGHLRERPAAAPRSPPTRWRRSVGVVDRDLLVQSLRRVGDQVQCLWTAQRRVDTLPHYRLALVRPKDHRESRCHTW